LWVDFGNLQVALDLKYRTSYNLLNIQGGTMKTKLKYSMVALMTVATMFAYADDKHDIKEDYNTKDGHRYKYYTYDHCDTNRDGVVDSFELQWCDDFTIDETDYAYVTPTADDYLPGTDLTETDGLLPGEGPVVTFQSTTGIGNCLPGQNCTGYVGTADDYFAPALPGASSVDVFLFTKDDVDIIVQKKVEEKLQECRNNPESCGIKTFSTSVSDLNSIKSQLQNREFRISGYYLQFGSGTYDWMYVTPDGSYAAKLEEGVDEKGNLRWSWIQKPTDKGFSYINIDQVNNTIYFGDALGDVALPGM